MFFLCEGKAVGKLQGAVPGGRPASSLHSFPPSRLGSCT
uniref:Uncharacterized protein n=1 Tax=virus sp. ctLpa4 TaxID=2825814 RepID=A0A8S5RM52_9VIRU|nr:MAG TPA: hypothetical protein [virus sp. ctLpa4]